ncbi:actin-binding protein IPP-like, partial [Homarus americanus]|uniref:actin-binding protein IPP-like n=1 Tax=Homarus americanus TaxID=6706 RepID=UPI001C471FBA
MLFMPRAVLVGTDFLKSELDPSNALGIYRMGIVEHRGLIYIMGGYTDTDNALRDLLSYNPVTGEWKNLAPMLGGPCDTICVAVLNNFLYVVGGTELEEMERYSFEQAVTVEMMLMDSMGIVKHRGLIYIIGGYTDTYTFLCDLLSYNPVTGEWKNLAPMLGPPCNTIGVAVLNNFLGYMDFYNPMHDLLSYNPVTGEWRALAGRAPPRYNYMGVAVLNNFLYLVGGLLFNEEAEKSLERYSFEQNKWFKCSPMNFDRSIPAVVATNSLLYVIGGHRQNYLNRL